MTNEELNENLSEELASVNARLAELEGLLVDIVGALGTVNSALQGMGNAVRNYSVVINAHADPDLLSAEDIAKKIRDEINFRS